MPAMNQATVGDKTFKLPSLFQGDQKQVLAPEQIGTIVPFPDWMTRKLKAALPGTGVIGLVGSPGSGKRTLLKQASTIPLHFYNLKKSHERCDLRQLISHLQPTFDGTGVWALYPASLLSEGLVREMVKRMWSTRIVLVSDNKIWGLDNKNVIYHNSDWVCKFARVVATQIGATREQLQACGDDLRQLQQARLLDQYWMNGCPDKTGHPFFDTKAILNGKILDPNYYNKAWLEHNVLASTDDLDVCSKFYNQLAFMDEYRWIPGKGGCKEEDKLMDGRIMSLSLDKTHRAPDKLEKPQSVEITGDCLNYRAFNKEMKKMAADLQGDDAEAQLARANKRFLANAFGATDFEYAKRPRRRMKQPDNATLGENIENTDASLGCGGSHHVSLQADSRSIPAPGASGSAPVLPEGGEQPDEMRILSDKPEYDLLHGWGLYRTNLREYHVSTAPSTLPMFHNAPADLRNSKWLCVFYSQNAPLELITKTLEAKLPCCLIDATSTADAIIVFIYKSSQRNIRSQLKLGMLEPKNVQVASFGKGIGRSQSKNAQKDLTTHFQQQPGKHITNMHLGKASEVEEYTAKTLLHAVKDMTSEAFTKFVLDARLKMESGEELSELERLLCNEKIESRVKELRKLSSKVVTNVVYASKVKETGQVQPEKVFKSTWKKLLVTIHDRSLLTPLIPQEGNKVTLETFLNFPELHQNVTLFIPGDSRTGKTELAKYICLLLAVKYQNEDPRFLMTNTLDSLRTNQALMLPGVPVLLDDIGGDDNDQQLIYSSISMWKAILQVKDATQSRARNDDLMWAARQPKVMTSNCLSLEDWIGVMFPRAKLSHKQAIVLRTAEVQTITGTLYSNSSAPSGSVSFLSSQMSSEAAIESIASLLE